MPASLVATGLAAAYGERMLFSDLDFLVAPGDVVGLVGANGAGKSTLLRMLAGLRPLDAGRVTLTPPDAAVGYLPQDRGGDPGETVEGFLARRTGVAAAQQAMDAAAQALAAGADGADERYAAALERWLALGGADLDERAVALAADVGLGAARDAPLRRLSGGQAARAGLLSLLLSRFDVVLLDEPTNDLDLAGLDRLERFVAGLRAPAVVVSHDREFLDRTVTRVVELDLAQQRIRQVEGGYAAYLAERAVERRHEREEYDEYARRRDELTDRARRQRAWMEKGVANARRKAPDHDKVGRKFRSETTEKQAAKARQSERLLERLEEVVEPRKEWQLRMEIAAAPRSGTVVAEARDAVVHRGGFRLGPVTLRVDWADRVAVTGPNGAGKTTLLRLLLGRVAPGCRNRRARLRRAGRRDRPGPPGAGHRRDPRPRRRCRAAGAGRRRGTHAAGQVRAAGDPRGAPGGLAVTGGADPRRDGAAAGPRRQPAGARRADQPPRPAGDRAAGVGGGRLRRHRPARHTRPADAAGGANDPAARTARRRGARGRPVSTPPRA